MLLDEALESRETDLVFEPRDLRELRKVRHKAKRFVFDEDASVKAGRFATECADIVCENAEFALAPFPDTYIELELAASLRASSRAMIEPDAASRIGFLFLADGSVTVCIGGDGQRTFFLPFRYHRKGEGVRGTAVGGSQEGLLAFLVGEVSDDLRGRVREVGARMTDIWDVSLTKPLSQEVFEGVAAECRGQFKRGLAALLLLNQKRGLAFRDMPPSRRISRGKLKTYMAHSVVSIALDGPVEIRRAFRVEERASPRRHEVRGHFVHYGVEEGCSHEWKEYRTEETLRRDLERAGRPILRWRCANCHGMRVRREAFYRGDATKGYVTKTYTVKG